MSITITHGETLSVVIRTHLTQHHPELQRLPGIIPTVIIPVTQDLPGRASNVLQRLLTLHHEALMQAEVHLRLQAVVVRVAQDQDRLAAGTNSLP
jgi:hypothetical protein